MEIPQVKIGDVCDFSRGLTYKKSDEVEFSSNAILRANNITLETGRINFDEIKYISNDIVVPISKKVRKGGLLICTASGSKKHLGKVGLIDKEMDFAFGGFMGMLIPKPCINSKYLYWLMQSKKYSEFIFALTDGANINNLKFSQLSEFELPLLPIEEQERIVAVLDEAFDYIDGAKQKVEKNLRNISELFELNLKSAINGSLTNNWRKNTPNITPSSILLGLHKDKKNKLVSEGLIKKEKSLADLVIEEKNQNIPKSWITCNLGEIGNAIDFPFVDGPFGSSINTKKDYIEAGVPVLRMINVKPFKFKDNDLKYVSEDKYQQFRRHNVLPGDVLFSKVGAGTGEACIVPSNFEHGMLATTGITRIRVGELVINEYLCCFLNANIKEFMSMASKAAQPFLNMTQIKTFPFPLPPIDEQKEIVRVFNNISDNLNQARAVYEQKLNLLGELQESLLEQAFTGKLTNSKGAAN